MILNPITTSMAYVDGLSSSRQYNQPFLIDRTVIITEVKLDERHFSSALELIDETAFSRMASKFGHDTRTGNHTAVINLDSYGSLRIYAEKVPGLTWRTKSIQLNPGKLMYGHNGRALSEQEFFKALSFFIEITTPLLANKEDFIHLVPGLATYSKAYWNLIEIPFQVNDADGKLLHAFSNARHPEIRKSPKNYPGESVRLGAKDGDLNISIYRKDVEQAKLCRKFEALEQDPILRAEVILKGKKLIAYLALGRNHRVIDGSPRLVCFTAADLIAAHRLILDHMTGCYKMESIKLIEQSEDGKKKKQSDIWPTTLANIAFRSEVDIHELLELHRVRHGCNPNTMSRLRRAAAAELERLSPIRAHEIFSPSACLNQPSLRIPKLEVYTQARRQHTEIHPLILNAYGSRKSQHAGQLEDGPWS